MWRSAHSQTPASLHGTATGTGTVSTGTSSFISDFPFHSLQFIQPPGSLPSEVLHLALPRCCRPWLPALAWYLRQNLLIFLHSPKYTDSNSRNHFQVRFHLPLSILHTPQLPSLHPTPHIPLLCNCFYRCPICTFAHESVYTYAPSHLCLPVSSCASVCTCPPLPTVDTHSLMVFVHSPSLSGLCLFSPQHPLPPQGSLSDLDIYLYNKPGGQGTGGKGIVQDTTRCGKAFPVSWLKGPFPALQLRGTWW